MTKQELDKVIEIYKPKYDDLETDIPTYIRNRDAQESESLQRVADDLRQRTDDLDKTISTEWTDMIDHHCTECHKPIDKIESAEYNGVCEECAQQIWEATHIDDDNDGRVDDYLYEKNK